MTTNYDELINSLEYKTNTIHPLDQNRYVAAEEETRAAIEQAKTLKNDEEQRQSSLGNDLIIAAITDVVKALADYENEHAGLPGRPPKFYAFLRDTNMNRRAIALCGISAALERGLALPEESAVTTQVRAATLLRHEGAVQILCDEHPDIWKSIQKRTRNATDSPRRMMSLIWKEVQYYNCDTHPSLDWQYQDKVVLGATILQIVEEATGLFTMQKVRNSQGQFQWRRHYSPRVQDYLANHANRKIWAHPRCLPLVNEVPQSWSTTSDGGHPSDRSPDVFRNKTTPTHRALLEDTPPTEMLEAINVLQKTSWCIEQDVLEVARHAWSHRDKPVWRSFLGLKHIPEISPEFLANRPKRVKEPVKRGNGPRKTKAQREAERAEAREQMTDAEKAMDDKLEADHDKWISYNRELWTQREIQTRAKSLNESTKELLDEAHSLRSAHTVNFSWFADTRGRLYPSSFRLSPQGTKLSQALLTFAEARPVDEKGLYWLRAAGAASYGLDKASFDERVRWTIKNEKMIREIAADPITAIDGGLLLDVEEPPIFLAFCFDYVRVLDGQSSTFPVKMDATSSGLQILSALVGDEVGAKSVNVLPNDDGSRGDIYTDVANALREKLEEVSTDEPQKHLRLSDRNYAKQLLGEDSQGTPILNRNFVKRAVMTIPYAATRQGVIMMFQEQYADRRYEKGADIPFDQAEEFWSAAYLYDFFIEALKVAIPSALATMDFVQDIAGRCVDAGVVPVWTTPSGTVVVNEYHRTKSRKVSLKLHNRKVDQRVRVQIDPLDGRKVKASVSPNMIHSLDASLISATVLSLKQECPLLSINAIHDCIAVHAADADKMMIAVRASFARIFSGDVLQGISDEMKQLVVNAGGDVSDWPQTPKVGEMDLSAVSSSEYFFS